MTQFLNTLTTVRPINLDEGQLTPTLAPRVYSVRFSQASGYYLSIVSDNFVLPPRVFGDTTALAERFLNTFNQNDKSTGVLLTGDKGSGKSLLAKVTCNYIIKQGVPVILVEEPHRGSSFNEFINSLGTIAIFIDEFGKIYKNGNDDEASQQEGLLSLLDGYFGVKRLVLLTENYERDINEFLKHRPGRVLYHKHYGKLDIDVISQYCAFHDVPSNTTAYIIGLRNTVRTFSIDILEAIVTEYKRYPELDMEELIGIMNIAKKPTFATVEVLELKVNDNVKFNTKIRNPRINLNSFALQLAYYDTPEVDGNKERTTTLYQSEVSVDNLPDYSVMRTPNSQIVLKCKIIEDVVNYEAYAY